MKLRQACEAYGLVPAAVPVAEQFYQIIVDRDDPHALTSWFGTPQFDGLWDLLARAGTCQRDASSSGVYDSRYKGTNLPDMLIRISSPRVHVVDLPTASGARPFITQSSGYLLARLRFDVPDPVGDLCEALTLLLARNA